MVSEFEVDEFPMGALKPFKHAPIERKVYVGNREKGLCR